MGIVGHSPADRLKVLRAAYQAALGWKQDDLLVVDYLSAWAVANRLGGHQAKVWGFLVGPSGVGKTEAVFPMYGLSFVFELNTLTEKSLISGLDRDDGRNYSILPLLDRKLVVMPEFTTIVHMPPQQSNVIMAELRSLYDGLPFRKAFGTGIKQYDVRFGLMACVTPTIDPFLDEHTQLGERFVMFRLLRDYNLAQETELLRRIRRKSHHKESWRATLKAQFHRTLRWLENDFERELKPPSDDHMLDRVQSAAQLVARSRSVGRAGTTEPLMETNAATRIIQQFLNLGAGRMILEDREEWNEEDWHFIRRVAEDTFSREGYRIIKHLIRRPDGDSVDNMARCTGIHIARVIQIVHQWEHNELTERVKGRTWKLSPACRSMLSMTGMFKYPMSGGNGELWKE